jgi:uncharacterized membrane protein YphA (DoxX/SURF4 family)
VRWHSQGRAALGRAGYAVLLIAIPAMLITFMYSWDPFSLKGHGLGELTVFIMFGPLLVLGVNVAVNASIDWMSVAYSVPLAILTSAVLFANNIRDVEADRRGQKVTMAILIGPEASVRCFGRLMLSGYVSVALLLVIFQTPLHQGLVLGCLPWALYLVRRVQLAAYHELPQSVAQHNLLFGVLLTAALSEPMFVIRVLMTCLYALGGINNIMMWQYNRALVHQKLTNVWPALSPEITALSFALATGGQIVASLAFMLGFYPKLMAQLLLVFIIPVTFVVHDMWTIEHDNPAHVDPAAQKGDRKPLAASRSIPIFPTEFDNEFVHFFKNVGMIGALYLYIASPTL